MSALGLPAPYWRLWSASTLANVGDGIREAALPLVAAAITRDPGVMAGVAVAQRLPWLVIGLPAGVVVDRVDARRLAAAADGVRAVALAVLAAALVMGRGDPRLLLGVAFLVGAGEVVADSVATVAIPQLVVDAQLPRANSLLASGQIVANEFVGPPLGAALFLVGAAVPVAADAGTLAIAGALLLSLPVLLPGGRTTVHEAPVRALRSGVRAVWSNIALRRLTISASLLAAADAAWFVLLALFVMDVLGRGAAAFGGLLAVGAVGGLGGSVLADRLAGRLRLGAQLAAAMAVTAAAQVVLGLSSSLVVVAAMLAVTSAAFAVFNVASVTLRQRLAPSGSLGRVTTVIRTAVVGAEAVGAATGGVVAELLGLRAPMLVLAPVLVVAAVVVRTVED